MMNPSQLQRRRLLKGLCAAGVLAQVPFAGARSASAGLRSPKMAVFLPRSSRYPTLSAEYLAGLQLGVEQLGVKSNLIRPIEYGSAPGVAIRRAQALLTGEPLDVLTGVICPTAALALEPTLLNTGVPLLVNDTGANCMARVADSGLVIRHSLEYWQSCAAFGHWAATSLGKRAVLALGTLEYGYDFPKAFSDAFTASGGTLLATHVSGMPQAQDEFSGLESAIQAHRPDFVFALYSGPQAKRFLDMYRASAMADKVLLAGGGFLGASESFGNRGPELSVASWHAANVSCTRFSVACATADVPVTPFSVLGYESGERIANAWLASSASAEAFAHLLRVQPGDGPREQRHYQTASMESHGAHWIAQTGVSQKPLTRVTANDLVSASFAMNTRIQPQNGWSNPYLVS